MTNFSIFTLNTNCLVTKPRCHDRITKIAEHILESDYDVVCLQEVFKETCRKILINKLQQKYPYMVKKSHYRPFGIPNWLEDSGLFIASKYTITDSAFQPFINTTIHDSLSWKGFLGTVIELNPTCKLLVVTTHLQHGRKAQCKLIRTAQIKEFQKFMSKHTYDQVIFLGDMNIKDTDAEYNNFLTVIDNYTDAFRFKHPNPVDEPGYTMNGEENNLIDGTFKVRYDYIFTTFTSIDECEVIKLGPPNDRYSDHYGILCRINTLLLDGTAAVLGKIINNSKDHWTRLLGIDYFNKKPKKEVNKGYAAIVDEF